jgi:hypothetical protein
MPRGKPAAAQKQVSDQNAARLAQAASYGSQEGSGRRDMAAGTIMSWKKARLRLGYRRSFGRSRRRSLKAQQLLASLGKPAL